MNNYEYCILTNEKDIIEYEKGLYKVFKNDEWYLDHYIVNGDRMRAPYKNQQIFGIKKDNRLIGATAMNIGLDFQANYLGFKLPDKENICENLHMYLVDDEMHDIFTELLPFFNYIGDEMKRQKFKTIIASCTRQILPLFEAMDFEVLDQTVINGEEEYFITLDF